MAFLQGKYQKVASVRLILTISAWAEPEAKPRSQCSTRSTILEQQREGGSEARQSRWDSTHKVHITEL